MAKVKIRDITLEQTKKYCNSHDCSEHDCVLAELCRLSRSLLSDEYLDQEVDLDEPTDLKLLIKEEEVK